jgi:nucleoside-diphosphate-sugar epimerase
VSRGAIVFGGAGFIGSHLLKSLAASGEYDTLVSADIQPPRFQVPGVRYVHCDVRQPIPDELRNGVNDGAEIYNLAAVHTTPGHEDWEYYWTNVLGAIHIVDFARRSGINIIVFTSSIAVYGPTEDPKDEISSPEPEIAYGKSKLCAEKIHQNWQSEHADLRKLVMVRPAVIYGYQERGNFTRLAKLMRAGRFVYPGRRTTIKSCGYVSDLVRSFRFMLDRPEPSIVYNFAHPERYTAEDICRAYAKVGGFALPKIVVPISLMMIAGRIFELLSRLGLKTSINRARILKLYRSTNIVPRVLKETGFNFRFDLEASLQDWLALSPIGHFE